VKKNRSERVGVMYAATIAEEPLDRDVTLSRRPLAAIFSRKDTFVNITSEKSLCAPTPPVDPHISSE